MTINPADKNLPPLPDMASLSCDGILNRHYHLYQPKQGYRFGTDAIMLAAAVAPYYGTRIADFGAGAGAVTIALAHFLPDCHITALEKEEVMTACLRHNIALNDMTSRVEVRGQDIVDLPASLHDAFDCVVANPPFHHASGTRPRNQRRSLAHHGDEADLGQWVEAAWHALRPKGRFVMIVRADRTDEVMSSLQKLGAGGLSLQPLWPYSSSPAIRVIIHAQKNSKAPFSIQQGLVLHHPDGALTGRATQILSGNGAGLLAVPDANS